MHNEALLRWRDDCDNLRMPEDFLAALDGTGLLAQLDRLVIQKAIVMLTEKPHIRVSVNLSREVLSDRNCTKIARLRSVLVGKSSRNCRSRFTAG